MRLQPKAACTAVLFAALLLTGCAIPKKDSLSDSSELTLWRGRLAVRIESDQPQPLSFSASFELTGSPSDGELTLYTPLGNTAAVLTWNSQTAVMRANGATRHFESLDALIRQAVGTDVPVAALFAWLAGDNMTTKGWSADLTEHANGRITARRTDPAPLAELRLLLEK